MKRSSTTTRGSAGRGDERAAEEERKERKVRALAIFGEADRALDGWTCPSSTECCRFAVTGREPWLTQIEWELVVDEVRRQGRRLPVLKEPDGDEDEGEERCPFLTDAGKCGIYARRPLGCRTFFCERASGPPGSGAYPRDALKALPRALDALTVDNERSRPLRSWLRGSR